MHKFKLFGITLYLEWVVLAILVYLMVAIHTVCGRCSPMTSSNVGGWLMEGFDASGGEVLSDLSGNAPLIAAAIHRRRTLQQQQQKLPSATSSSSMGSSSLVNATGPNKPGATPDRGPGPVHSKGTAALVAGGKNKKEGFTGANLNDGQSASYSLTHDNPINTAKWMPPDLVVTAGQQPSKAVMDIVNRPNQSLPLPEGEMVLFANTPFKPECCPSSYSNSMGCACINTNTYNYLITRGGNNVPYSEY